MSNHPKYVEADKDRTPVAALRAKIPRFSGSDHSAAPRTRVSSLSVKSVLLYDWWLARADSGKGFAVAGFTIRETLGVRDFRSAAIVKRLDTNVLESKDGIVVALSGFINRSRTLQNGFSAEVCSRFRLGFPYGWEKYGVLGYGEQSATGDVTRRKSGCAGYESSSTGKDTDLAVSLDDLPVTRIRDSLMFATGGSEGCGLDEILRSFCRQHTEDTSVSSCSSVEKKSAVTTVNHSINQTPRRKKKMSKAEMKGEGGNEIEKCVGTSSRGVTTRSMSRLGNLRKLEDLHSNSQALSKSVPRKKPDRKLSSNSATITDNGAQLSTPEEVARNDQKVIPAAVSSEEATDYFPYRSPCKRSSSRLKTCKS